MWVILLQDTHELQLSLVVQIFGFSAAGFHLYRWSSAASRISSVIEAMSNALISSCDVDGFRVDTPMSPGAKKP